MSSNPKNFHDELIERGHSLKLQHFHNLMHYRIRDILLVSSLYDSYIFEEDERLYELIRKEYQGLNLSHTPELVQVSNGEEAIRMLKDGHKFDLVITTLHIEDMSAVTFARKLKDSDLDIPIVLLNYDNREMTDLISSTNISLFNRVFIWQGDYRIVLAIIRSLEDKQNVDHDTKSVGVQSIILIEDNVKFYSSFLPLIYSEVLKQSENLISEGINLSHKFLRSRARPKILLCSTFEEAWDYFDKYEGNILGVISDIDFIREGQNDKHAGILYAEKVKQRQPHIPILLQSTNQKYKEEALKVGTTFLLKDSPTLLEDLKKFMSKYFGFGDFVFQTSDGYEVGRAKNLNRLKEQLYEVPDESIIYHAARNDFSTWMKSRTEFHLAKMFRPKKIDESLSVSDLRKMLIDYVHEFIKERQTGVISDFNIGTFDSTTTFARIGDGSLGGKARGLGFVNSLLSNFKLRNQFSGIKIFVPPAVVLATDVFDQFLAMNNLREFALKCNSDEELKKKFFKTKKFPIEVIEHLQSFLELVKDPLAVRSSSLLEDSQGQPFAGVYDTFMLPNDHPDLSVRLRQLLIAIKRIYVSVFLKRTKDYMKVTNYSLEEEKMAVIVQKMVGAEHNGKYYPEFSGVAKSFNFYPTYPLKSTDGIVSVAPGLGISVVNGGFSFRFCPKYPLHQQFGTIDELLRYSPHNFDALDFNEPFEENSIGNDQLVKKYYLTEAENDGTLNATASTYSIENDALYDGVDRNGPKIFTLAPILKDKMFPLAETIDMLLEIGNWGTGSPVEIEFAVNLSVPEGKPKEFALLQMRPLVINYEVEELEVEFVEKQELICKSEYVLGHGIMTGIQDIICVDPETFERKFTTDTAHEIGQFNSMMVNRNLPYLLIGFGRWGTLDPWLGIPVTWEQINGARAIVESNFQDFNVLPSQGSHFFQNLTSFRVGYFTVNTFSDESFIDWEWLKTQHVEEQKSLTKHIRLDKPLTIKINGHLNRGIILKP